MRLEKWKCDKCDLIFDEEAYHPQEQDQMDLCPTCAAPFKVVDSEYADLVDTVPVVEIPVPKPIRSV